MAYELRADREGVAVATLNTKSDAFEAAIGVLRTHKMDRAIVVWDDDGTLSFTKTGSKNPMLYVVKSGPKDRTAEPKKLGRPPIDQTDCSLASMPPGVGVWHYLSGKKQRVFNAGHDLGVYAQQSVHKPIRAAIFFNAEGRYDTHLMFGWVDPTKSDEPRKGLAAPVKLYAKDEDVMKVVLTDPNYGWPKYPRKTTHVIVGTVQPDGMFIGRWCYRRA
jgi:hypothetical protein